MDRYWLSSCHFRGEPVEIFEIKSPVLGHESGEWQLVSDRAGEF